MQRGRFSTMFNTAHIGGDARLLRALVALSVALIVGLTSYLAPLVYASGETISASDTATTEMKQATNISGIVINGTGNDTIPVKKIHLPVKV